MSKEDLAWMRVPHEEERERENGEERGREEPREQKRRRKERGNIDRETQRGIRRERMCMCESQ